MSYAGNLIMAELLWSLHSQCRERRKQRERGRETVPSRGSRFSQTNCILRQLHFDNLRLIYFKRFLHSELLLPNFTFNVKKMNTNYIFRGIEIQ